MFVRYKRNKKSACYDSNNIVSGGRPDTPQTVDCALCTEHHQKKCGLDRCPYLKEKIEAGVVSYKTLVDDCFADTKWIGYN